VSDTNRDHRGDIDLIPAAEQDSEVGDVQEGDDLGLGERRGGAEGPGDIHLVTDDEEETNLAEALEAVEEAADPEADALVDEALEVHSLDEAEAAEAATDDEAVEAVEAAPDADADEAELDPYEQFRKELRAKFGKWYVIHSYAGFEKRVKQNIEQRKGSLGQEDAVFEVQVPMEDVVRSRTASASSSTACGSPATCSSGWTSTRTRGPSSGTRPASRASSATRTTPPRCASKRRSTC
jgi:transcriptional antiterminator NusG